MKKAAIFFIRVYQSLSPALSQLQLSVFGTRYMCPQSPTCSEYTIHQIEKHGTITGLWRGIVRIYHCR